MNLSCRQDIKKKVKVTKEYLNTGLKFSCGQMDIHVRVIHL